MTFFQAAKRTQASFQVSQNYPVRSANSFNLSEQLLG
jgi:hypothetical protein